MNFGGVSAVARFGRSMTRMPTAFHAAPLAGLTLRCQSDARLVSLCREGHVRAFEEIVRRYRPQLVSFAGAIVPAHRAEDVVQEALTKAHSSLATSDGEMKLKPWLYRIVRNRALNDLRDEPRHQRLDEDFDGVPQPPEVAARRAELAELVAGVKSLPAGQREALLRRELEGRSHQEIAAAIGVTPGAVRGLIFRARSALREGASALIPLPVVRALLSAGPLTTEATGAGVGVGGAAAGLTAGGGGGIAIKAGAALLVAGLAVGSGVALHDHGDEQREATAAMVARGDGSPATRSRAESGHGAVNGSGRAAAPRRISRGGDRTQAATRAGQAGAPGRARATDRAPLPVGRGQPRTAPPAATATADAATTPVAAMTQAGTGDPMVAITRAGRQAGTGKAAGPASIREAAGTEGAEQAAKAVTTRAAAGPHQAAAPGMTAQGAATPDPAATKAAAPTTAARPRPRANPRPSTDRPLRRAPIPIRPERTSSRAEVA